MSKKDAEIIKALEARIQYLRDELRLIGNTYTNGQEYRYLCMHLQESARKALLRDEPIWGIKCPWCNDEVWSRHRHDCRSCKCGYCYIDGGRDYTRVGFGGADWPEPWPQPKHIKINLTEEGI